MQNKYTVQSGVIVNWFLPLKIAFTKNWPPSEGFVTFYILCANSNL